jgi:phosphate transport system ATP-binding protein
MDKIKTNTVFHIENLSLQYGSIPALKQINLEIERNKITALIGPSGCGKSSFLRVLNRMNDLIQDCLINGEVCYQGINIYNRDIDIYELRRKVGMVFQKPNPFPMSIYDNIAYGPKCQGVKDKKQLNAIVKKSLVDAVLWDEVKDRLKHNALELSGGQQQRLCIARAIAMEPDVILMDEPTSALDPIATLKIEELIETLKEKYTIVIVTHNMQQAARISDKIVFFLMGEIVETGNTDDVLSSPKDKRTENYITGRFG